MDVGFVKGQAMLAPLSEPTIAKLKSCAAVLAVKMIELSQKKLDLKLDATKFYCDSKVVIEYNYNETRRFYLYVKHTYLYTEESPYWNLACIWVLGETLRNLNEEQ